MASTHRNWLVPIACLALLGGCGGDDEPERAATVSSQPPAATVPTATTSTQTQTTAAMTTTIRKVSESTSFRSPSGNVGCVIEPMSVRCDIEQRTWKPPPSRDGCQVDYGQGIEIGVGGPVDIVCAGDTTLKRGADEVAYDEAIQAGDLRCDSRREGMTCRDVTTGHGFLIARERYRIF